MNELCKQKDGLYLTGWGSIPTILLMRLGATPDPNHARTAWYVNSMSAHGDGTATKHGAGDPVTIKLLLQADIPVDYVVSLVSKYGENRWKIASMKLWDVTAGFTWFRTTRVRAASAEVAEHEAGRLGFEAWSEPFDHDCPDAFSITEVEEHG